MRLGLSLVTVDAFTDVRFGGNPAAVCILPRGKFSDRWMQKLAREMNLSETAFLVSRDGRGRRDGFASYDLRWFTPIVEVDLCGHATLASAHLLWEDGHVKPEEKVHFHTRSGLLKAERRERDGEVWIELEFPAMSDRPFKGSIETLAQAIGARPRHVGRTARTTSSSSRARPQ